MELFRDLRYISRSLMRNPGYTAVVVIMLAFGIGANAALFLLVNAAFFRPLPYGHAKNLVLAWSPRTDANAKSQSLVVSYPDFIDWQNRNSSFEGLAAYNVAIGDLAAGDVPITVGGAMVSRNFFSVLDIHPLLGTEFSQAGNDEATIILGYELWQRQFGGKPSIIGEKILLSEHPYVVIGILPRSFIEPEPFWEGNAQFWILIPGNSDQSRNDRRFRVVGRLHPGVSMAAAQSEMRRIGGQLADEFPKTNRGRTVQLVSLRDQMFGEFYRPLLLLFLGSVAVLLIACTNVTHLQLARVISRSSEMRIRSVLGAGRFRLSFWVFGESLLLALLGAAGGVLLALLLMKSAFAIGKKQLELVDNARFDMRILLFILGVALAVTAFTSYMPVLRVLRYKLGTASGFNAPSENGGRGWHRFRTVLAVTQLSLLLPLLIGSALFSRSFYKLSHVDPGFRSEQLLTFRLFLAPNVYTDPLQVRAFLDRLAERLQPMAGVESVAFASALPLTSQNTQYWRSVARESESPAQGKNAYYRVVSPNFFQVMGIPMVAGRTFLPAGNLQGENTVIVNAKFAQDYWPGQDPLGERIYVSGLQANGGLVSVVGVVGNVHDDSLAAPFVPTVYVSFTAEPWRSTAVIIQTGLLPNSLLPVIRSIIRELNPRLPMTAIRPMQDAVHTATSQSRFALLVVTVSAVLAFVLALLGVIGVVTYLVTSRQREFGIRIALGAQPKSIIKLVFSYALRLAVLGSLAGLGLAMLLNQLFRHLIYGITTSDFLSYCSATLILVCAVLASCYIPARKLLDIHPASSLRAQ
jgi:putative ABC transport system permease protein